MPELPEVETIVRDLKAQHLVGQQICRVNVSWKRSIATPSVRQFISRLEGSTVSKVYRRAKYIVIAFHSGASLLIHLRMTGRLNFFEPTTPRTKHDHVIFGLGDKRELRFTDTRKFGRLYFVEDTTDLFSKLGPEPLSSDFKLSAFEEKLAHHQRMLKPLLLDQSVIAGLGNIYVDEALYEAFLHPERLSNRLKPKEVASLHQAIIKVLRCGIDNLGTSLGTADTNYYSVGGRRGRNQDALKVFRRTGEKCPRCKTTIKRLVIAQRSSHICAKCQKKKR